MKYIKYYSVILYLCLRCFNPCAAQSFAGIWENAERFIEYTERADDNPENTLRMVLKTYYRFVYEDMGTFPVTVRQESGNAGNLYTLSIGYPQCKIPVKIDIWIHGDELFTSFYKKIPYSVMANSQQIGRQSSDTQTENAPVSVLEGFWIEQGYRDGILIYPQDSPIFVDAFFFTGTQYIKFRYWKGDFEYKEKNAEFVCENGVRVTVPKLIRQSDAVYSCITSNGSKLKNYEKGSFLFNGETQQLTILPQGGGPGSHAIGDTYPHSKYPQINALPLFYDEKDGVFAFGAPFLTRSSVVNLQEEMEKRNSLKRSPPEPLLKADELDFYWERIKDIRKRN